MIAVDGPETTQGRFAVVVVGHRDESLADGRVQRRLVIFDLQHIVGLLVDDGLGDLFLAAHRIDGDGVPFEIEEFQKLRNGGDFIGFLVHRELREEQPGFGGPRTDQVQSVRPDLAVV